MLIRFSIALAVTVFLSSQTRAQNEGAITNPTTGSNDTKLIATSGPGWKSLGKDDFVKVNSADDTWSFKDNLIQCTGKPVSVMRSKDQYTNFELVCQWRHLKKAGNSGIFVWTIPSSLEKLKGPGLPQGVEVQVLDHWVQGSLRARWQTQGRLVYLSWRCFSSRCSEVHSVRAGCS